MLDDHLRYPIGKFSPKEVYSAEELNSLIDQIGMLPQKVEESIAGFSTLQFDTPYREGGWTIRQVIHHLADSHMNAYIRFKWTLTESTPVIKAYDEKLWANTPETNADSLLSVTLLKALHAKWVLLLRSLTPEDLKREFIHPETRKHISLHQMIALYAWHGQHHVGHINIVGSK
ncbi:MAG: putative metal-dependent hydrolase [Cyclobacteriaceae bacterium]|nr:putative metal-dependent hydrolase [Cyclobacteriaceae bacterium]